MKKFTFWASIIFPILLGIVGYYIASILPIPSQADKKLLQILYSILGIFVGIATFSRLTAWIVRTFTNLIRVITARIASEVISQISQIRHRGLINVSDTEHGVDKGKVLKLLEKKFKKRKLLIIDTSSLIDGRILDVAKTSFLEGVIVLPQFVLKELQFVADSSDSLKRSRGRKGFEIVEQLKKVDGIKLIIWEKEVKGSTVDDKLISLTKSFQGKLLTCDYNLNKLATLSGITVLNLNELANALRAVVLPGEQFEIKILQKGKDKEQGVGYLDDGTMVVVENGANLLNQNVVVEATKMIQNPAGRIVFSKVLN